MSDDRSPETNEVHLGEAARASLGESADWIASAQRKLGELTMGYVEAKERAERLESLMRQQVDIVLETEAQHAKILSIIIDSLNLPAGDWRWVYDARRGSFVKEPRNA